jgi:hypothetical protein
VGRVKLINPPRLVILSTARQLRIMEIPPEQPPDSAEEFARLIETAQKYVDPLSPEAFGLKLKSPRKVQIKNGPRRGQWSTVSSGKVTDKFKAAWQIRSEQLKAAGYRYEEYRGRWQVSYFQDLPEQPGGTKPTPIPPNFNNISRPSLPSGRIGCSGATSRRKGPTRKNGRRCPTNLTENAQTPPSRKPH